MVIPYTEYMCTKRIMPQVVVAWVDHQSMNTWRADPAQHAKMEHAHHGDINIILLVPRPDNPVNVAIVYAIFSASTYLKGQGHEI